MKDSREERESEATRQGPSWGLMLLLLLLAMAAAAGIAWAFIAPLVHRH